MEACSVQGASEADIFMQIFQVRARLSILPRVLSEREKEEGHLQLRKKKGHCSYCSMLNGWRISMHLPGALCSPYPPRGERIFFCRAGHLLFKIGI